MANFEDLWQCAFHHVKRLSKIENRVVGGRFFSDIIDVRIIYL